MPNTLIETPFQQFTDKSGKPLTNGYIYIGQPGLDPQAYPLPVFFDANGTIAAPSPLRTNQSGFPTDGAGNPKRIYTTGQFSIRVRDANGVQIYYAENSADGFSGVLAADLASSTGASRVGYKSSTLADKLGRTVDVKDFGAVGDNINNDKAAFELAAAEGVSVFLPPGQYNVPSGDFSGTTFYSFGGAQVNNATVAIADVTAAAFPVGAVMSFPCVASALPVGFVPLDGATLNRAAYPDLWSFAQNSGQIVAEADWSTNQKSFSSGNGSTTFRVPNRAGELLSPQTVAIRAFSGAVNPGLVNVTEIGNQVGTNTSNITGLTNRVDALAITKGYTSADTAFALGGFLSFSHGLGVAPELVQLEAVCTVAVAGYSVGHVLPVAFGYSGTTGSSGVAARFTSSVIELRVGTQGATVLLDWGTGGNSAVYLTPTEWNLRVRAYA